MNNNIDDEWENFISNSYENCMDEENMEEYINDNNTNTNNDNIPKCSDIYISTKTKIAYLNQPIHLKNVFWKIPIIEYNTPTNGVIKKQIKVNSITIEEFNELQEQLSKLNYYDEHVITHINNPEGRIKFKDTRKISIGLSKKDILSYRCKKKSAFYNCFVLILRIRVNNNFNEYHVKVFNTGKLEIPGVQTEESFNQVLTILLEILQPFIEEPLSYIENSCETVLINSNFNCGFYINREKLYTILKSKYNIQAIYDPCSYPGIQCKFYYNNDLIIQNGSQISEVNKELYKNITKVSFMIFRTGSALIVGKCDEKTLISIYNFVKNILLEEYENIYQTLPNDNKLQDIKNKKTRKKFIVVQS